MEKLGDNTSLVDPVANANITNAMQAYFCMDIGLTS